jgi:hypothetical protein
MDLCSLVDTDMLRKVISQLLPSAWLLDPIPTTFFKTVFNCISEEDIVNHSPFTGTFPTALNCYGEIPSEEKLCRFFSS